MSLCQLLRHEQTFSCFFSIGQLRPNMVVVVGRGGVEERGKKAAQNRSKRKEERRRIVLLLYIYCWQNNLNRSMQMDIFAHCFLFSPPPSPPPTHTQSPGAAWKSRWPSRLSSPSLIVRTVSVNVKQHCESRGGRPGLPVAKSPYGLCGRKATVNLYFVQTTGLRLRSESPLNRSCWTLLLHALWTLPVISLMCSRQPALKPVTTLTANYSWPKDWEGR